MKDTITLGLEGDIALDAFARAIGHFTRLVRALSDELSDDARVEWMIEDLYASSAVATVRGISEAVPVLEKIVDSYVEVGDALALGHDIPFSPAVQRPAVGLARILNDRVTAIRFETSDREVFVAAKPSEALKARALAYAYGTLTGTVQMLTMRRRLRFTLYDVLFDNPVSCYLREGQEEQMREAWGKRAAVSGSVGRDPDHGRPRVVRDVSEVRVTTPTQPGSYKRALGVIPWAEDDEPPEAVIERLRSGQWPSTHPKAGTSDGE